VDGDADGFTAWLLGYQRAGTPRGDLAREVAADNDWPGDVDVDELRDHLQMMRIPDAGMEAFDKAWGIFLARGATRREMQDNV